MKTETNALLEKAQRTSEILRALSHEHRLAMLSLISTKEYSVGDIEKALDLPQPAVSQQLARLRADGLVQTRRDGRTIYYCANKFAIDELLQSMVRILGWAESDNDRTAMLMLSTR